MRGCGNANTTNSQLRESGNSQENSGKARAEGSLDRRPSEQGGDDLGHCKRAKSFDGTKAS